MDRVSRFRAIVKAILEDYSRYKPSHGEIDRGVIVDPEKVRFELMHVGWDGQRRVHGSIIHLDIIGGKVWIQYDGTDRPVAEELLAAGVPREDIVRGFHPADVRPHREFAAG